MRRALTLMTACGLVAAFALGPLTAGTQAQTRTRTARTTTKKAADPAQQVLARVGKTKITRADYDARLEQLPAQFKGQVSTPEQKKAFLDRLIEERIWLETAVAAGVEKRPDVQSQIANTRRDLLIRTYLGEAMAQAPQPSDSAIAAYYEAHQAEYMAEEQAKVRHIQVKDEKAAKQVRKELARSGADFVALAKKYSVDPVTKDRGGDLGPVTRSAMFGSLGRHPALAESAFAAPVGVVRGPIKTGLGWHFLEVTEKIPATARPLDSVRSTISQQLAQEGNQGFYQQSLEKAKADLGVRLEQAAIDSLINARKSAVDMFREAGEQAGPDDRIRAYRRVVELYPDNEYAPQALFMVGFVESEEKKNYDQAQAAFNELVAKYPSSELAQSAKWMLENMRSDKTPEFELPGDMGPASGKDDATNKDSQAGKPH
ncbi:MAG: peptidyl-prolyl cis-trans isomerase [Candidatus Eisenbacteria bacterium]